MRSRFKWIGAVEFPNRRRFDFGEFFEGQAMPQPICGYITPIVDNPPECHLISVTKIEEFCLRVSACDSVGPSVSRRPSTPGAASRSGKGPTDGSGAAVPGANSRLLHVPKGVVFMATGKVKWFNDQ